MLAQNIRNSNEIEGIKVDVNKEVKLSQYADDTTAFLANAQFVLSSCTALPFSKMCWAENKCIKIRNAVARLNEKWKRRNFKFSNK